MADKQNEFALVSVEELLDRLIAVIGEARSGHHTHRRNRLLAKERRIIEAIETKSDGTARALAPLLAHKELHVRLSAATYYKAVDRDAYLAVMQDLAKRHDEIGQEAQSSLSWDEFSRTHPPAEVSRETGPSAWHARLSGSKPPPGLAHSELERMLVDAFPRDVAMRLFALARPAIRAWPQPLATDAAPTCSRFGGLPVVPPDWVWPTTDVWPSGGDLSRFRLPRDQWPRMEKEPRWFLAQINCADLAGFACAKALPRKGVLGFFGDSDQVTGCEGGGERGGVFYWPSPERLRLVEAPVEDFEILPSCSLGFVETIDLPDPFSDEIAAMNFDKELRDHYFDLRLLVRDYGIAVERYGELDGSKLFGWPDLVQGPLQESSYRLLLQVGNFDNGTKSWGWGPGGLVYFAISEGDLAGGNVHNAICDMQCT